MRGAEAPLLGEPPARGRVGDVLGDERREVTAGEVVEAAAHGTAGLAARPDELEVADEAGGRSGGAVHGAVGAPRAVLACSPPGHSRRTHGV